MARKPERDDANSARQKTAERAYLIWESMGRPHGYDLQHWIQVEAKFLAAAGGRKRTRVTSEEATVRKTLDGLAGDPGGKDEDIDYTDIPPLTDEQIASMRPLEEVFPDVVRKGKTRITIRIDNDVLAWFKAQAEQRDIGYQALINHALRTFINVGNMPSDESLRHILGTITVYLTHLEEDMEEGIRDVIREELAGSKK